jgi:hypothetical protein
MLLSENSSAGIFSCFPGDSYLYDSTTVFGMGIGEEKESLRGVSTPLLKYSSPSLVREGDTGGGLVGFKTNYSPTLVRVTKSSGV